MAALTIVLFLLSTAEGFGIADLGVIAGYVGIIASAGAVYMAASYVLAEALGRDLLPVYSVKK